MLSMAFIQAALRKRGVLPQGRITSVGVVSQHVTGSGADLARLALTYDSAAPVEAPTRLVAKIAAGEAAAAVRRELRFYRLIAPALAVSPAPRLLGVAAGMGEQDRWVLLFEDLDALGYVAATTAVSQANLEALSDLLAELHAPFWNAAWPADLDFSQPMESSTRSPQAWPPDVVDTNAVAGASAIEAFLQAHYSDLEPRERDLLRRLQSGWGAAMTARAAGGDLTLIHGDFHLTGNVFLRAADRPKVIDWSEVKPGLGPHDLAYALISLPAARRADRDTALLRRYHQRLQALGVAGYTWDRCLWDYRFSLPTNLIQSARQSNLTWMRRTLAAVWDLQAERLLDTSGAPEATGLSA